jgi:hypothetical protein
MRRDDAVRLRHMLIAALEPFLPEQDRLDSPTEGA